jgi:hypothetical protein
MIIMKQLWDEKFKYKLFESIDIRYFRLLIIERFLIFSSPSSIYEFKLSSFKNKIKFKT